MRWLPWMVPSLLLGIALFDLPYGYYQLLRVALFLTALFHLLQSVERSEKPWAWVFGAIALVYNPISSLSLGRALWTVVNLSTIAILALHWWLTVYRNQQMSPGEKNSVSAAAPAPDRRPPASARPAPPPSPSPPPGSPPAPPGRPRNPSAGADRGDGFDEQVGERGLEGAEALAGDTRSTTDCAVRSVRAA